MSEALDVEILLVEDNQYDAELALKALGKFHLANKIFHVSDGEEALDFVFGRGKYEERNSIAKPKVILLDLKLPKIGGLEVLEILKKDPATRSIPVVILTTSREESDMVSGYQLGVNSYLVKPIDFEKFCGTVEDLGLYWLLLNQLPE